MRLLKGAPGASGLQKSSGIRAPEGAERSLSVSRESGGSVAQPPPAPTPGIRMASRARAGYGCRGVSPHCQGESEGSLKKPDSGYLKN